MKRLFVAIVMLLTMALLANAQTFVDPNMIEISYNNVEFDDATQFVSNINITTGAVSGLHVTHVRRGAIITLEAQLGTPYIGDKVTFLFDSGLIPESENKFYVRWKFGVTETLSDGTLHDSFSSVSDSSEMKLTGKPDKLQNKG
jgi:hypothetical protein